MNSPSVNPDRDIVTGLAVGGGESDHRVDRAAEVARLIAEWTRIGAGFNVDPAESTPDLERLILDTSRYAAADSRLFSMATTWLGMYDKLVARHRLARLVVAELEPGYRPVLGLLLDLASTVKPTAHFNAAMAHCPPADLAEPLFEIDRQSEAFRARAERRASDISRRWNLWIEPMPPKKDAIRPGSWIIDHNPEFRARADFKGDLRASIMESLRADASVGGSESELARACGATRVAVRSALEDLETAGWILRVSRHNRRAAVIRHDAEASVSTN